SVFERKTPREGDHIDAHEGDVDAVVYGLGRHGALVAGGLCESGWRVLGVDIDPDALQRARGTEFEVIYGDAEDPEFALSLPLQQVLWVVSTVPNLDINLALLHGLRAAGYDQKIAMTAHSAEASHRLNEEEVDLVLSPFALIADQAIGT